MLTQSGIVRSDIRASIAGASGVASGVPLTVKLKLVNTSASCANLAGYAVYLWHCTREGGYSLYSAGVTAENFLRGVQVADSNGRVSFTSVFPGCYSGRWPHIHFEIYRSTGTATQYTNKLKTSQLAVPESIPCTPMMASVISQRRSETSTKSPDTDAGRHCSTSWFACRSIASKKPAMRSL